MKILTLLILPLVFSLTLNPNDVLLKIELLKKSMEICADEIKDQNAEISNMIDLDEIVVTMAGKSFSKDCLEESKRELEILKELYPGLFKSFVTNTYIKDPKVMMAIIQLRGAADLMGNQVINQYNILARSLNQEINNSGSKTQSEDSSEGVIATSAAEAAVATKSAPDTESSEIQFTILSSKKGILNLMELAQKLMNYIHTHMPHYERLLSNQLDQLNHLKEIFGIFDEMNGMK